jgi:sulfonate transport system substrate-binding protein
LLRRSEWTVENFCNFPPPRSRLLQRRHDLSRKARTEAKALDFLIAELREIDSWAKSDIHAVAEQLSSLVGLPVPILEVALKRQSYGIKPIDDAVLADQQKLADTLYQLKLIPKEVRVSDIAKKLGS